MTDRTTYKDAGVDIDAGNRAVALMKDSVSATHGSAVLAGVGAFGGLFSLDGFSQLKQPVLAASTDGVGTKVRLATQYNRLDTIGQDLVNHCINDIMVQGAIPIFFLDYVASSRLDPEQVAAIVTGMAAACRASNCALLGGETAEMPGVYSDGEVDVVGTIVGIVDRDKIVDCAKIRVGDVVLGLPSASPHTNGYSLIRHVLRDVELDQFDEDLGAIPLDLLLEPHRSYFNQLYGFEELGVQINGLVHVTGGGYFENPPRVLSDDLAMHIDRDGWEVPKLYRWIQEKGGVSDAEMYRVFNMGVGMLVIVPPDQVNRALSNTGLNISVVGEITERKDAAVTFSPSFED
jgi:phosphoribosylformylglycinamidine cyclo-ligase